MQFIEKYFTEAKTIIDKIDRVQILKMISIINETRSKNGRMFILGVGGGAGHASHAVNDFRKICGIESYAPTDNVSELTARVNDDGWESAYVNWLKGSKLNQNDMVFIFSVGGGHLEKNISANIVRSLELAQKVGAKVCGVVGRDGGYTAQVADACVVIPSVNDETVTPHTEGFQAVIWHLLVSHPDLQKYEMKWESAKINASKLFNRFPFHFIFL
jgi:D-sedoheptulose 7-phosphate isomerase